MPPVGLHASDTHLRARAGDEEHAFTQLVDAALAHKVSYVCLAGDLLDKQSNRSRVISFLAGQLGRLHDAGIAVLYTQGQHDQDEPPWFTAFPWTEHLHRASRWADGVRLYGLDWQPYGKLQEELAEIPADTQVLVCHQVWGDWMGEVAGPQGSFAQIPGHVKFVHTGDLHQWKLEKRENADGAKMTVLSTGATTQQKVDEPAEHHYALVHRDLRVEKKTLNSRVMLTSGHLLRPDDVDAFIARLEPELAAAYQLAAARELPEALLRPYLRVVHASRLTDVVRRVEKAVGDRARLSFKQLVPEDRREAYRAAQARFDAGQAVTPLSVLHEEVDKAEKPGVYELVSRVLGAQDQEAEFARWRAEYMGEAEAPPAED